MIEVASTELHSARDLDELIELLGIHIGRTLKVEAPAYEPYSHWGPSPRGVSFGTLKWVRLMDGQDIIKADLGRPFDVRDHGTVELINLTDTISVLVDGVWRRVHTPKKKDS